MKKTIEKSLLAVTIMSCTASASAELINTDWLAENDSQAVLDTISGTEWLSVTLTQGKNLASITSLLETQYQGWSIASSSDVETLFSNTFTKEDFSIKASRETGDAETLSQIVDFKNKFGITASPHTYGLYTNDDGTGTLLGGISHTYRIEYELLRSNDFNYSSSRYGVFLINDGGVTLSSINDPSLNINNANAPVNNATSVPLPATFGLLGLGIAGLSLRRKA
jgi:hypothetical protein